MHWLTWSLYAQLLALMPVQASPVSSVQVQRVWIAASVDGGLATDREARAVLGTEIRLYVVVEGRVSGRTRVFSNAPRLRRRGRLLRRVEPWPTEELGPIHVQFYKLEPDPPPQGVYDNTGQLEQGWPGLGHDHHPDGWHWCPIDYVLSDPAWGNVWEHPADAHPTTTADDYGGLGTMRFVARVQYGDGVFWTPGRTDAGELSPERTVRTVRFRKDDTAVGHMTELLNVPYVYGSSSPTGGLRSHQTERALGADCADLVVYGHRQSGRRMEYTWTGGLRHRSRLRVAVSHLQDARYRQADGALVAFGSDVRVGDMLLWNRHVAVIAEVDPSGHLTPDTLIIHTVVESAALVPLREVGFGFDRAPFEVRRLKRRSR